MQFFFVRDSRHRYCYFSTEPVRDIQVKTSRLKKIWAAAKEKIMLLPQKVLRQEQAFARSLGLAEDEIEIIHSGCYEEKKIKMKFYFFLQKQRSKHILILIGETLLLPLGGLAGLLPGPNVFFGALALLMITHWQALRGINRILKKKPVFRPSPVFARWENSVAAKEEAAFPPILQEIERSHGLKNISKVLWK